MFGATSSSAPAPVALQLSDWRMRVLNAILNGSFIFWVLAFLAGVYNVIKNFYLHGQAIENAMMLSLGTLGLYTLIIVVIAIITLSRQVGYRWRATSMLAVLYLLGTFQFSIATFAGDGRAFLFIFVILTTILFDSRAGVKALALTLVTWGAIGWAHQNQVIQIQVARDNSTDLSPWITGAIVFVLLAASILISTDYLLRMLTRSLTDMHQALAREQRLGQILSMVNEINQLILHERDSHRLIQEACVTLTRNHHYAFAWASLLDQDGITASAIVMSDAIDPTPFAFRLDEPTQGPRCAPLALHQRHSVHITSHDPDLCTTCPLKSKHPQRSALVLPLICNEHAFGTIQVVHTSADKHFDPEEETLLQQVANNLAFALNTLETAAAHTRLFDNSQQREIRFQALIENATDGIALLDSEGIFQYLSPAGAHLVGYTSQELVNRSAFEFIHPDDLPLVIERFAQDLPVPNAFERLVFRVCHHDGNWIDLDVAAQNSLQDPAVQGIVINFHDITESRQAQIALQQREAYFRALIENSAEGIAVLDEQGIFRYVAPPQQRLTGYPADAIIGMDAFGRIHPDDLPTLQKLFDETVATPDTTTPIAYRALHSSGVWRHYEGTCHNLLHDPNVAGIVINYRDVSVRKRAEERERRHYQNLETVNEAVIRLLEAKTDQEIYHIISTATRHLAPDARIIITKLHADDQAFRIAHDQGWENDWAILIATLGINPHDLAYPLAAMPELTRTQIQSGHLVHETSFYQSTLGIFPETACDALVAQLGIGEIYSVGFVWGKRHYGGMALFLPQGQNIEQPDAIETIAHQASLALQRCRAEEALMHRVNELEALAQVASASRQATTREMLAHLLIDTTTHLFHADVGALALLQNNNLVVLAAQGLPETIVGTHTMPDDSVWWRTLYHGELTLINDTAVADAPPLGNWCRTLEPGLRACASIPLKTADTTIGLMCLAFRVPHEFSPDQVRLLNAIAEIAGVSIHRVTLHEQTQQQASELATAYESTLEGWARALELRDQDTLGHTLRVAELTLELARAVGMDEARLPHVRRGALLHDMGKMAIPDRVLLKPGPLTDEERMIMRQHPTLAYNMLSPIAYLHPALDIPYCHHEKWDGTGYPRQLSGENIPLAARVFAVADVWDALTSDRPYRPAWSASDTRMYLREQAGTRFDPHIVETFLRIHQ